MATERLVFADSHNRDSALYPSGNSYVLHLTTPIKNIERVDLVSARVPVPNTLYNLTNGSNQRSKLFWTRMEESNSVPSHK
jgi:hypothetical protein